jgi:hypothetical protein
MLEFRRIGDFPPPVKQKSPQKISANQIQRLARVSWLRGEAEFGRSTFCVTALRSILIQLLRES